MKQLVQEFSEQLEAALDIGQSYSFISPARSFNNIVLTGLGGSGIGGSIVQNYVSPMLSIPFIVNKDYVLPAFVNEHTLLIVSSYSGNTEETIAAFSQGLEKKATIVCITSGGEVAALANERKLDCIMLPGGMPPRACLGYSLVQVLFTLAHYELIPRDFEKQIMTAVDLLDDEEKNIQKRAKAVAKKLEGTTPILYAAANYEGVAVRFRQQINENSKMLCWHHVLPEMNHNELVGWRDKDEKRVVVMLRNSDDYSRTQLRFEINKKMIKKLAGSIIEISSMGDSYLERAFYLIHLTDWVSVYLAELHQVDATEVNVIDFLKGELAKDEG